MFQNNGIINLKYKISIKSSKPQASCLLVESSKYKVDSDGNPIKKYLLYDNNERTGYRELTKDEVANMILSLEKNEGHTNGSNS